MELKDGLRGVREVRLLQNIPSDHIRLQLCGKSCQCHCFLATHSCVTVLPLAYFVESRSRV